MNLIMILYGYFNSDTRVQREVKVLIQKGFGVEIINLVNLKKSNVENIKDFDKLKNIELMKVNLDKRQSVKNLFFFWLKTFLYLIKKKNQPNVIHAHDLTGLPPAIMYKILFKKVKIIYDSHELFPEAAMDKLSVHYWLFFLKLEKFLGKYINLLIGASPMQLKILKKRIDKPQICLLNLPDLNLIKKYFDWDLIKTHPLENNHNNRKIKICYAGGVNPYRGYDELVLAAKDLINLNDKYNFWIIGDGPYLKSLKKMVKDSKIQNNFVFFGQVPHSELLKLIYGCDIALGLYQNTMNNHIMISNKIFEYMLVGIPYIFTDLLSSRDIIKKVNAVRIIFPINPKTLSEKILYLQKNKVLQRKISEKSQILVKNQFNWRNESKNLLNAYLNVLFNS